MKLSQLFRASISFLKIIGHSTSSRLQFVSREKEKERGKEIDFTEKTTRPGGETENEKGTIAHTSNNNSAARRRRSRVIDASFSKHFKTRPSLALKRIARAIWEKVLWLVAIFQSRCWTVQCAPLQCDISCGWPTILLENIAYIAM